MSNEEINQSSEFDTLLGKSGGYYEGYMVKVENAYLMVKAKWGKNRMKRLKEEKLSKDDIEFLKVACSTYQVNYVNFYRMLFGLV